MKPQLVPVTPYLFSSICWEKNDSDLVGIMYIPGRSPSAIPMGTMLQSYTRTEPGSNFFSWAHMSRDLLSRLMCRAS